MSGPSTQHPWSTRWASLARAAGLRPEQPVALGLSGGADSVYLLHVLARAEEAPRVLAIHVDHGLRGEESLEDAAFCARLCARLGVPFARARVELDPAPSGLEARAREARYQALAQHAAQEGLSTVLTGHHADDALETLLQRWTRGSFLPGLPGLKQQHTHQSGVQVVRPLLSMRREEVRRILQDEDLPWREDTSNLDTRFLRNRIREGLLPTLDEDQETEAMEGLRAFAQAVEGLEIELASRTAHVEWSFEADGSAAVDRTALTQLPRPLRRRVLWRLIQEGCGGSAGQSLLDTIAADLDAGSLGRHTLPGGWRLDLTRTQALLLTPGTRSDAPTRTWGDSLLTLPVPGLLALPDGRALRAERIELAGMDDHPMDPSCVELDADHLDGPLTVRGPREGDTIRPLGAPGTRKLARFLADAGVPAVDRSSTPLVLLGDEVVWVAGVRPTDQARLREATRSRIRLTLLERVPRGESAKHGSTSCEASASRGRGPGTESTSPLSESVGTSNVEPS